MTCHVLQNVVAAAIAFDSVLTGAFLNNVEGVPTGGCISAVYAISCGGSQVQLVPPPQQSAPQPSPQPSAPAPAGGSSGSSHSSSPASGSSSGQGSFQYHAPAQPLVLPANCSQPIGPFICGLTTANFAPAGQTQGTAQPANTPAGPAPAPAPAPPPPPSPQVLAQSFWTTIPLPHPNPSIPPGFAITGKTAYLVTGGTTSPAPFTENTILGPLSVTPHGQYTVDWGDGTTTGPFSQEGAPWPTGTITHTYDNVGTYTVTVTENWTATWSLGPAGGTLGGLVTTGAIPNFAVRQIQGIGVGAVEEQSAVLAWARGLTSLV